MVEQDQQKPIKMFIDTIKDENKLKIFVNFLELVQNDKLQTNLDKFNNIQQNVESLETEREKITEILEHLKETQNNFSGKFEQISEFYNKIFVEKKGENGEVIHIPLDKFIDNAKERLEKLYDDKNIILTSLYDPMAAEGLSKAYVDEKKRNLRNGVFWTFIFGVSIGFFLYISIDFWNTLENGFKDLTFLKSLPFWIFSGFFTFYSTKQIAEYKRMASEYAHKETLNRTYIGYKTQVENIDSDGELKKQLLQIMLKSANFNPSEVLENKGEIPSLSVLEKIVDTLPLNLLKSIYEYIGKKINPTQ